MNAGLNMTQAKELARYEANIRKKLGAGYAAIASASPDFAAIDKKGLYIAEYATFREYCEEVWGLTQQRVGQIIRAGEFLEHLKSENAFSLLPTSDRHVLPILAACNKSSRGAESAVDMHEAAQLWAEVERVAKFNTNGKPRVTTAMVESVVAQWKAEQNRETPSNIPGEPETVQVIDTASEAVIAEDVEQAIGIIDVTAPPADEVLDAPEQRAKTKAIRFGNEAVDALRRIPKNDPLRKRGFQIVTDWIRTNANGAVADSPVDLRQVFAAVHGLVADLRLRAPAEVLADLPRVLRDVADEIQIESAVAGDAPKPEDTDE